MERGENENRLSMSSCAASDPDEFAAVRSERARDRAADQPPEPMGLHETFGRRRQGTVCSLLNPEPGEDKKVGVPLPIIADIPTSRPGLGFPEYVEALADAIRGGDPPSSRLVCTGRGVAGNPPC
jgi:hypothetical protein